MANGDVCHIDRGEGCKELTCQKGRLTGTDLRQRNQHPREERERLRGCRGVVDAEGVPLAHLFELTLRVVIDDEDLADVDGGSVRRRILIIQQEPVKLRLCIRIRPQANTDVSVAHHEEAVDDAIGHRGEVLNPPAEVRPHDRDTQRRGTGDLKGR